MTDYLVNLNSSASYSVGVDYEIPTKSTQNTNLIIDDINGQFNGIGVTFSLNSGGDSYSPLNDQQLIVCKNNLVMEPGEDFTIAGDQLIFSVAPIAGDDVFIIAIAVQIAHTGHDQPKEPALRYGSKGVVRRPVIAG